jgi:hypothetical protein
MNLIKYTLTKDGKTPNFIIEGGYFPIKNNNQSPEDYTFIGLSQKTENKFNTYEELLNYLKTHTDNDNYTDTPYDHVNPNTPFDYTKHAVNLWSKI